jgi:hypothetical protein
MYSPYSGSAAGEIDSQTLSALHIEARNDLGCSTRRLAHMLLSGFAGAATMPNVLG